MKKINDLEHKKIMLKILKYFDETCRKNNINYSLIGGTLIGAIRHKGIIPWDDDIDVILTRENYEKIIDILKSSNNQNYFLLDNDYCKGYYLPFSKLVDKRTFAIEPSSLLDINEYGVYIDIFCYNNLPNDKNKRIKMIKKIKFYNGLASRKKFSKDILLRKRVMNFFRNTISIIIGSKRIKNQLNKIFEKYRNTPGKFVVSNWPIYAIDKEIQSSNNIKEYIDVPFEDMKAMIFKGYDGILKTSYGNYMQLPPKDKRVSHGLIAYWRDENEQIKK